MTIGDYSELIGDIYLGLTADKTVWITVGDVSMGAAGRRIARIDGARIAVVARDANIGASSRRIARVSRALVVIVAYNCACGAIAA